MNWLNLEIKIFRAPEYIGSEPVDRATWMNLLAYCCEQENGGRIVGCAAWKDRQWQQTCGVTRDEAMEASALWSWDGDDLVVWAYPVEKQTELQSKRLGGRNGGVASGDARRKKSTEAVVEASDEASREAVLQPSFEASREAVLQPSFEASREAVLQRKGKEGKGIEGNGKEQKEKTERVPRSVQNGAHPPTPHFDPPDDNAQPSQPKDAAGAMLELEERVKSLRREWNLPMTRSEYEDLMGCARALDGLTDADWRIIREYLQARLPQGSPGWQPRTRAKFLQSAPDVWAHASEWHRKNFKPLNVGIWR